MALTLAKTLLLGAAALAFYVLWLIPLQTGFFGLLTNLQQPNARFAGPAQVPVRQRYTGIKSLDVQISSMVGFFWPGIDGSRPDVSLALLEVIGQVVCAWVLFVIEGLRVGNRGVWYLTSITVMGTLMQSLGFAFVCPIWMFLHLKYSPTVDAENAGPLGVLNPTHLLTLPISFIVTIVIPNILMTLAPPTRFSPDTNTQQFWVAVVFFWPILLFVAQIVFPILASIVTGDLNTTSELERKRRSLRYLRRAYVFALIIATVCHVAAFGIPLLAYAVPKLFDAVYLPMIQLRHLCVPLSPFPLFPPITSAADGVLEFLKWECYIGFTAVLVWAVALRQSAQGHKLYLSDWVEGFVKLAAVSVLAGPCGAAVLMVWERDEVVFGWDFDKEKTKAM